MLTYEESTVENTPVGHYLKNYRKNNGLSQSDLASQLDVSQMTISYWERGRPPSLASLARIAEETLTNGDKDKVRSILMRAIDLAS